MHLRKRTQLKWLVAQAAIMFFLQPHAFAQTATTPQTATQNQAAGLAFGASMNSSTALSPSASSTLATTPGANNVWGTAYTGTAEPALTGTATSSSMIGIGTTSVNKSVAGFNGYNNNRDQQADQAAVFLKTNPLSTTTLPANDALRNTSILTSTATDPFASSASKTCEQRTLNAPLDSRLTYTCQETYNPYTVSCGGTTTVDVVQVAGCTSGQSLGGVNQIPNGWGPYRDRYLVMNVTCANNGDGYLISAFTSTDSVNPYQTLFSNVYVSGKVGTSQGNTFIANQALTNPSACNWPYYFSQSCDAKHCTTHLRLIGSQCNGGDFDISNTNLTPMVNKMNEATTSSCTALEGLTGP